MAQSGQPIWLSGVGTLHIYLDAPPRGTKGKRVAPMRFVAELRDWLGEGVGANHAVWLEIHEWLGRPLPKPPRREDLVRMADELVQAFEGGRLVALQRDRPIVGREESAPKTIRDPEAGQAAALNATDVATTWIRVRIFDPFGSLIAETFPSVKTFDLALTDRNIDQSALSADLDVEAGGSSACTITVPELASSTDPVLLEPPDSRVIDLESERKPVAPPVALYRYQFGEPQRAWLATTNVFRLLRREASVFELEHFADGSVVLRPEEPPPEVALLPDAKPVLGIDALRACLMALDGAAPDRLLAIGHGSELCEERAQAVRALLLGDRGREDWRHAADAHSTEDDVVAILAWAAGHFAWACSPSQKSRYSALRAFQEGYNRDVAARRFFRDDGKPRTQRIGVDGLIGPETWGAIFDCYLRALRPTPLAPPIPKPATPFLIVDDRHMTYPALLARISAPGETPDAREGRWPDLNPLNPGKVIPDGGGWYPIKPGDVIYLADEWDIPALAAAGYNVTVPQEPRASAAASTTNGPLPLESPGPEIHVCGTGHVASPHMNADGRRAAERKVEVVLLSDDMPTPIVCDGSGACTAATCELYDARQYALAYREDARVYDVFFDLNVQADDGTERYRLVTSDSDTYDRALSRGDARLHGNRLRLRFTDIVPGATYSLRQVLAPGNEIEVLPDFTIG
jgi:hypothetical protein